MRNKAVIGLIVSICMATTAWAGECGMDTQVCLNHLAQMADMGWIGIDGEMSGDGYTVTEVTKGTPAFKVGIKVGDVMTKINGASQADENFMAVYMEAMQPGKTTAFTYMRGNKEKTAKLKLLPMPKEHHLKMVGAHMLDHAMMASTDHEE